MPKPEDRVIKHSGGLWEAAREGLISSNDLSPSLRLDVRTDSEKENQLPKKDVLTSEMLRANLPFVIQRPPWHYKNRENTIELDLLKRELKDLETLYSESKKREEKLFRLLVAFLKK